MKFKFMKLTNKINSNFGITERSAVKSFLLKPISLVLGLIYTPILLSYLGDEKYGVWVTMFSIINWISNFDIGIGNGLRNVLSKLLAQNKIERAQNAISTAFLSLTVISLFLLVITLLLTINLNWESILNTSIDAKLPIIISIFFICLNFVLSICNIVLHSLQKSEIVSLQGILIHTINIAILLILRRITEGSLVYMSILFGFSTLIVNISMCIWLFSTEKNLKPSFQRHDKLLLKDITSLGLRFFIAQIAAVILFTTDNLLVSNMFGAINVTPFSLTDRVFSTGYALFITILVPFWSKTTRDTTLGNFDIIRRNFMRLNILALVFTIGCIFIALIFKPVVGYWLNYSVDFSTDIIVVMCIYYSVYSFCSVTSTFINGMGGVNGVMILGIIQGIVNIPLSIFLAKNMNLGILGIRIGTLIVIMIGGVFQIFYFHILLKRLELKRNIVHFNH